MKEAGLTTSLDTNDDPDDRWEGGLHETLKYVDVFLPNEREAPKAAGVSDLETAVKKLAAMVPLVVVKLGREGAMAQRGNERFTSPAFEWKPWTRWERETALMRAFCMSTCGARIWRRAWRRGIWRALFRPRGRGGRRPSAMRSIARNSFESVESKLGA